MKSAFISILFHSGGNLASHSHSISFHSSRKGQKVRVRGQVTSRSASQTPTVRASREQCCAATCRSQQQPPKNRARRAPHLREPPTRQAPPRAPAPAGTASPTCNRSSRPPWV